MSIDLLNTCASCVHSASSTDGGVLCMNGDPDEVKPGHVCDQYELDEHMDLKLLPEDYWKTCNDCQHYDPAEGICTKNGEERHYLDDKCESFEQETDTKKECEK